MILRLKAKLLATNIELQSEINEKLLQNQVDILLAEIDSLKKIDKNKKNQLKKLMNKTTNLRKIYLECLASVGIPRENYHTSNSAQCKISIQTDNVGYLCDDYTDLKSKLVGITDFLLTAVDDKDNEGFTVISQNTHPSSYEPSHLLASLGSSQPQYHKTCQLTNWYPNRCNPGPNPGLAHRCPSRDPGAPYPSHGLMCVGPQLRNSHQPSSSTTVQSRIRDILKNGTNPKHIVLHVADNDATKQESRGSLPIMNL